MMNWSEEERIEKFFEFCRVFDDRQDTLLREEYQIFSHRLHWHEHPYCTVAKELKNNEARLFYTLVFSFTNEHWGTFMKLWEGGIDAAKKHFETNRHARNDLFQIYYPKGTNVKEWILEGPKQAARDLAPILEEIEDTKERLTMMKFAKILERYFKTHLNFRSPLYPCKNAARYVAMTWPHLVDPESVLFGGTGHFDGLHQIFDGVNLNGKVKYYIDSEGEFVPENSHAREWLRQMKVLVDHPSNPIHIQKYLNIEDKSCFFYKALAIHHGAKRPTKQIPYTWIFPDNFNLANRPEFLDEIKSRGLMY